MVPAGTRGGRTAPVVLACLAYRQLAFFRCTGVLACTLIAFVLYVRTRVRPMVPCIMVRSSTRVRTRTRVRTGRPATLRRSALWRRSYLVKS